MVGSETSIGLSGLGGYGGGFGGFGGGGFGSGFLGGILGGALFGGNGGLFGNRGNCNEGHGDNARFIAVENSIDNVSEQLTQQAVLGAVSTASQVAAGRFDAVQNNINSLATQSLLAGERTNGNIAEVKFQGALNTQAITKEISDCCCATQAAIAADGNATRALITQNLIQDLRDKNSALVLENSQQRQDMLFAKVCNQIDKQNDALINFGTILNTKTNTSGIQS